jgi:hypothetical protein
MQGGSRRTQWPNQGDAFEQAASPRARVTACARSYALVLVVDHHEHHWPKLIVPAPVTRVSWSVSRPGRLCSEKGDLRIGQHSILGEVAALADGTAAFDSD